MSKAQQLINEYLREGRLAANRSQPIGAGAYGTVYESDVPGRVIKQAQYADVNNDMEREANAQSIAADMGYAPRVTELETFRGGIGNRMEMEDVRGNYEPVAESHVGMPTDPAIVMKTMQQLGAMALKGMLLQDRRAANIVQHKMMGRPMQLDFGITRNVEGADKAQALAEVTAEGLEAAGVKDVGSILTATVADYLEGGQVDEAMDIARQGFSRLQKIRTPLKEPVSFL